MKTFMASSELMIGNNINNSNNNSNNNNDSSAHGSTSPILKFYYNFLGKMYRGLTPLSAFVLPGMHTHICTYLYICIFIRIYIYIYVHICTQ